MTFSRIPNSLTTYALQCSYLNGQRYYQSPNTKLWYPSVTTVTGFAKKDFFENWRKDPANQKVLLDSQVRGEALHSYIEQYLKNEPMNPEISPKVERLFEQVRKHLDKIDNIVGQESPLFSDHFRIAGRFDCIAEYNGTLSIIDFKGSGKAKRKEYIQNYFEQAACYAVMFEELHGIKIGQMVILVTSEDGTSQEFKEKVKPHIPNLAKTIKSFWKVHDFNQIQQQIQEQNNKDIP